MFPKNTTAATHLADALPVRSAEELYAVPARLNTLREIERLAALPKAHFQALYRPALWNLAQYTQELPASEAHHHAGPGGLLDHTLDVIVEAMKLRRALMLPVGAGTDVIARQKDLYTYVIFTAALLQDIGKIVAQQHVSLFDLAGAPRGAWSAWTGPMPARHVYRIEFVRGRRYSLHPRLAPVLARAIVPETGLAWIGSDHEALELWAGLITGDMTETGPAGMVLQKADGQSVARNLGATTPRFSAAGAKPLHEKLLTALRYLLMGGQLPLNRDGAAGWLVGDDLWLVSKRAVDAVREHLQTEGHDGIPARNDRLFDVLQEHRLITPCGDQAIWRVSVSHPEWANPHTLTVLRLPAARIWPDATARPAAFAGTVEPVLPAREGNMAESAMDSRVSATETGGAEAISGPVFAVDLQRSTAAAPPDTTLNDAAATPVPKNDFLRWLVRGISDYSILVNQADARVHRVQEGVLLLSPAIFRDYARGQGDEGRWEHVQKGLLKLRLHQPTANKTNVHHYRVEKPAGNYHGEVTIIKGILLPETELAWLFGSKNPDVNPVLGRVTTAPANAAAQIEEPT